MKRGSGRADYGRFAGVSGRSAPYRPVRVHHHDGPVAVVRVGLQKRDANNVAGRRLWTGAMEEVAAADSDVAECAMMGVRKGGRTSTLTAEDR
jgi:hypothetical protein